MTRPVPIPDGATLTETARYVHIEGIRYRTAPLAGGRVSLCAMLYLPYPVSAAPLLVWHHGGSFKYGRHDNRQAHRIGAALAAAGVAVASAGYRLFATDEDLEDRTRAGRAAILPHWQPLFRPGLNRPAAFAALEDSVAFLNWAHDHAAEFGWTDRIVVGGTSAGAITAFNLAFTAPRIGLTRPRLCGVASFTGGYGYPDFCNPPGLPVYAQHNPNDKGVRVDGILMVKERLGDRVELHLSDQMSHGGLMLGPDDRTRKALRRLRLFLTRCCAMPAAG
ncbi:MAG: alpha/beta hydrolase fold domain-containing protein [Pseudomonadota bacterium]